KKRLEDQGIAVTPTTPEAFATHVKAETDKWTKVVRDAGLVGD
ncbi:MAG: tripartite tricarboxylate transporter substrate binding protein, partial [Betaproteobacteria bacterium]|nr:tripartite tricarboxylate transporter substrate binding protein [Betaproteobacteria bacterium]